MTVGCDSNCLCTEQYCIPPCPPLFGEAFYNFTIHGGRQNAHARDETGFHHESRRMYATNNHFLPSSSTRMRSYPHRPSGQAVVTAVFPSSPSIPVVFFSCIGFSMTPFSFYCARRFPSIFFFYTDTPFSENSPSQKQNVPKTCV